MTTRELMIFTTRCKGRFRIDYNEEILLTKYKDNIITVIGVMGKIVRYNERLEELK